MTNDLGANIPHPAECACGNCEIPAQRAARDDAITRLAQLHRNVADIDARSRAREGATI